MYMIIEDNDRDTRAMRELSKMRSPVSTYLIVRVLTKVVVIDLNCSMGRRARGLGVQ